MRLKRILLVVFLLAVSCEAYDWQRGESDLPPLQNGDLVFQTTWTNQSMATALASLSPYLHTGIVAQTPDGPVVYEAARVVQTMPLHEWIAGGISKRFSVFRYKDLTPEQGKAVVEAAKHYLGRPYDFYFYEGDGGIYCSQLDYLSYKDAGVPIGRMEKIGDLNINNRFVKKLIEERWQGYPQCKGKNMNFEQCYDVILSGSLVTPASIAGDSHLERIFTNYR